ncbi:unnamed protein product [Owenia fusiformis]|uniref:Ion transport domain-containing protein n=1 Tax=Owenia fusiformis TaxID=6347 RepID=A0A8J1XYM1_OWEFU|nr:unnamed protein product [Owenia fusiformis]
MSTPAGGSSTGASTPSSAGKKGESDSMSSQSTTSVSSVGRIISLATKGEWSVLDQILRGLDKGTSDINTPDEETGMTPLMIAARENKLVLVERLLDLGATVNDKAKDGRMVMHFAASYAKDDIIKLLINRKTESNITGGPKDQLPLHMACSRSNGSVGMVQMLVKASGKESRLAQDKDGLTALFLAAECGNTAVCRELLTSQAEQQIKVQRQDNGDHVLHIACRKKDIELAKLFIDSGASVSCKNDEGHTPLHISAWEGDEPMMKYLYSVKANPNVYDRLDRSPLHIAAERGNTSIVELLVDKFKANVAARTKDGSTLMHIASEYGHPDTAMLFQKKGVPLHMPNKSGAVCLHAAAKRGHNSVVKSLLQKGACVDSKTKDNYTAIHIAVQYCKPLVVQTLLGFGAEVEIKGGKERETPLHIAARVKDGDKCADMLIKSGADVNAVKEDGETALHIGCREGNLRMVQTLLEEAADLTWQSKSGETPLHVAVRYCHLEVAKELLSHMIQFKSKIDAIMLVNQQNSEGETAVHFAAELIKTMVHKEYEDTDLIKLMLEYEGDVNMSTKLTQETPIHYCARAGNEDILMEIVKNIQPQKLVAAVNKQAKNGWSPLLVASEEGHLEIVKILLQNHARVDVFDEHGKAALHLAAENGHDEVADVLLLAKAFVNAKSKLGISPLHLAAQNGFNKLIKLFIEKHGAVIDALSLAKKTPLHMGAQNGQIEVCSSLIKMKADANATDVHGQTPLHLAGENDHSDVVKLFLKHKPELVTMANTNGMTCAHIAAIKGSISVLKELMRFNKIVVTTARNRTNNSTALHLAAAGGHQIVVKCLLEAGASATDENADGMTAIHLAAKHGHVNILEALKGHVSWTMTSSKTGMTCLHVAAHFGQIEFVRELLTKVPATISSEPPDPGEGMVGSTEFGLTPLHLAAQSGQEALVRLLLNSPGVQADAQTAVQGAIPLHNACQSGHTNVVSLLLSKSTNQLHLKDKRGRTGLHLAAANGHLDLVSLLLGQGADINSCDKNQWTALHFAAKAGFLSVVKLLIESGASPNYESKDGKVAVNFAASANHSDVVSFLMKKDHNTERLMQDNKFVFDLMVLSKMNDNRSIREFILLSPAPADTAAKMAKNFIILSFKEKERSKDLTLASEYCESMAVDIMSIAASGNSAGMLLKALDSKGTPFLDVLIECEQKHVMSQPSVQKYLSDVWVGNLRWASWKRIMLFMAFLFLPPVWIAFSLPLRHRFNKIPIIKFMAYLVSHIYLILLYFLTIVYPLRPIWESESLIPTWYEWLLLAWLSGMLVSELTNPGDRAGLGWIKVIIVAISAMAVTIHIIGFAFSGEDRLVCLYVRNQFFGFALLLCFVTVLDFLSFHHLFGPWAIIIRDLMKDLTRFMVILSIFILGFTLHLAAIYQPVFAEPTYNVTLGDGTGGGGAQVDSPLDTLELLFFALFGLVEPENLPPINRSPVWSITLVKAVFGIYLIVTLIVLINLLIAMMSDTYQRIQAQSDTEWKFGRAKLIRNMNKTSATPSPLNLFTKLFQYIRIFYKHRGKLFSGHASEYMAEEEDMDTFSDNKSVDIHAAHSGANWLRNVVRRATQVAPEGGFLRIQENGGNRSPLRIDEVINWENVVTKYLVMNGFIDPEDSQLKEDGENFDETMKDFNDKSKENGMK